jgi:hypothetical protein
LRLYPILAAFVFVVTLLAFVRALTAGFCDLDDHAVLFQVDGYRGLSPKNLAWDFSVFHMGHFQPLTWVSYGIDFLIWGLDPRGFHLTSILLHAANAVLLYLVAIRLLTAAAHSRESAPATTARPSVATLLGSGAAALFFSLSPLRVESVAWITERRDVLSTFFLLLAALWYLKSFPARSIRATSPAAYCLCVTFLLVSLLAKSWGMSFFVVATILDIYPLRRLPADPRRWMSGDAARVLLQKLPLAALGIAAAIIAGHAQSAIPDTAKTIEQWGVRERLVQAVFGLFFYVWKTLLPANLSALYDLPVKLNPLEPRFIIAYAGVGAAVVALVLLRKKAPSLLAAAACYAVTVAPVLGLFQSGIQFVADRYSYVSCMSWAVLVGALVARCVSSEESQAPKGASRRDSAPAASISPARGALVEGLSPRPFAPAAPRARLTAITALAVAGVFAVGTWIQIGYWKDTLLLFQHAMDVGWDGPTLRQYYAHQLELHKDFESAVAQYQTSVEMNPRQGMSWFALGNLLRDQNRLGEAEHAYQQAVQSMYEPWRAYTALGLLYLGRLDRPADAVTALRAAVNEVERPDRPKGTTPGGGGWPYFLLAGALDETGDPRGSRVMLEVASKYPETREQALRRIPEVEAEIRGGR